jgi:MFS family permease
MLIDVPAGLLVTHHVRRAMIAAPVFVLSGIACLAAGGTLSWLLLGRVLMGAGHTFGMLGGLTTILKSREAGGLASALNAFEFSAMIGILTGVTVVGALPGALPWNVAFLIASAPMLVALVTIRGTLAALPRPDAARPWFARTAAVGVGGERGGDAAVVVIAFAAGTAVALTYGTVEAFLIPLRGSREFGLDRAGVARLLMLTQASDILALLPLGVLADRRGTRGVLAAVLLAFAVALGLVAFASLPYAVAGCVLFGLAMAGWMLPSGDAGLAGGVADGALPGLRGRWAVPRSVPQRPPRGAPRTPPPRHADGRPGGTRSGGAALAARRPPRGLGACRGLAG